MTRRTDTFGAFVGPSVDVAGAAAGPLAGLTFAAKDLFDIAGFVTGGGNPDWARTHVAADHHAWAVQRLLDAGARLIGKTVSDELAFSLDGENRHFGTPVNPAAPTRLPGGSSSGSAVAVAGGLADIALGSDTGGSVRVPAAFCGIFGFRPTHGAVSTKGLMPFAPSYDTVGWFARSLDTLQLVARCLLPDAAARPRGETFVIAEDAFALADPAVAEALQPALPGNTERISVAEGRLDDWREAYRILQGAEIRTTLGPWIQSTAPRFGDNIAPRFASLATISGDEVAWAQGVRQKLRARLDAVLKDGRVLVLPTVHCAPPARPLGDVAGDFYTRALSLTSIAGHAGLPQITLPLVRVARGPVALSLIGARGSDRALLETARRFISS